MDASKRLSFIGNNHCYSLTLGLIPPDHDISSELAGYEISKLLTEQSKLEGRYAALVSERSISIQISSYNFKAT